MGMTHTETQSWFWMTTSLQCMQQGEILWFDGSKVHHEINLTWSPVCWMSSTQNSQCWKKYLAKSTMSRNCLAKPKSELVVWSLSLMNIFWMALLKTFAVINIQHFFSNMLFQLELWKVYLVSSNKRCNTHCRKSCWIISNSLNQSGG